MDAMEKWLQWAVELQSLAQAGLTYGRDIYDKERYERIREISAEMVAFKTGFTEEKVKNLFAEKKDIKRQSWIRAQRFLRTIKYYW